MDWRLAKSLEVLRSEVNAKYPSRKRDSDGAVGDAAHASRSSDHNPWIVDPPGPNVVSAVDLTHDPVAGFDSYAFAEWLRTQRDPRVKYVISNRRIFSSEVSPWQWRRYGGANPHDHHVHISVQDEKRLFDDTRSWGIGAISLAVAPPEQQPRAVPQTLRRADRGETVKVLQIRLVNRGIKISLIDGIFGRETQAAVELWQKNNGLHVDGVVGPQTWKSLT